MKAILLISHGSKSEKAREEVVQLTQKLKETSGYSIAEHSFLDVNQPTISDGIIRCVEQGATEIIVLLNFLNSGNHVLKDIPEIIDEAKIRYPDVIFHLTEPIGQHPKIPELFLDLVDTD